MVEDAEVYEGFVNEAAGWCQCNSPSLVDEMMASYLRWAQAGWEPRRGPLNVSDDARDLLDYLADGLGWTEHGSSVRYSWLTDAGRDALAQIEARL